jgi:hypothetical protein
VVIEPRRSNGPAESHPSTQGGLQQNDSFGLAK